MNSIKKNQTVKGALAVLCAITATICIMSLAAAAVMSSYEAYGGPYEKFRKNVMQNALRHEFQTIWQIPMNSHSEFAEHVEEYNLGVDVELVGWDYEDHHKKDEFEHMPKLSSSYRARGDYEDSCDIYLWGDEEDEQCCVRAYIYRNPPEGSLVYSISQVTQLGYKYRYVIVTVAAIMGVIALILLVILMLGAGHRREDEEIHSRWIDRGMWDLTACATIVIISVLVGISVELLFMDYKLGLAVLTFSVLLSSIIGIICMMSLAVQCKTGVILRKSLIGICVVTACKAASWLAVRLVKGWNQLTASIPRTWKAFMLLGIFLAATAIAVLSDSLLLLLLVILIAVPVVGYLIVNTDEMDKVAERIAHGEFGEKINPKKMFGASRKRAENLNSIDEAVSRAVEERMKSEHFKTELITNVSHDIKTPLTSIINYAELLKQSQENASEDEKPDQTEYVNVIYDNALRLKKLTSDIVEASKASSGAIDVELSEIDMGMLVNQCLGEYQERLDQAQLKLVSNIADNVKIKADGKLMWRVADNLLSNICKYSAAGSRVYIDVKPGNDSQGIPDDGDITGAEIIFRNVSAGELNISADELMERFVRGDASRNTEGSGLGLSIARSLVELQGGTMDIAIDGDLFKVTLKM